VGESKESIALLDWLFEVEDEFLSKGNHSDFIFGIYSK
jgi:hypothetical protein